MPTPTELDDLIGEYTALDRADLRSLTADQANSLRYFRIERALSADPAAVPNARDRATVWTKHLMVVDAFAQHHGRLPRDSNRRLRFSAGTDESILADWLTYQRSAAARAHHTDYQDRRLSCLPGFSWTPHMDKWLVQLADYRHFLMEAGRAPRYRTTDPGERHLAAWAAKQRWRARRDSLDERQIQMLSELDIWTWN